MWRYILSLPCCTYDIKNMDYKKNWNFFHCEIHYHWKKREFKVFEVIFRVAKDFYLNDKESIRNVSVERLKVFW